MNRLLVADRSISLVSSQVLLHDQSQLIARADLLGGGALLVLHYQQQSVDVFDFRTRRRLLRLHDCAQRQLEVLDCYGDGRLALLDRKNAHLVLVDLHGGLFRRIELRTTGIDSAQRLTGLTRQLFFGEYLLQFGDGWMAAVDVERAQLLKLRRVAWHLTEEDLGRRRPPSANNCCLIFDRGQAHVLYFELAEVRDALEYLVAARDHDQIFDLVMSHQHLQNLESAKLLLANRENLSEAQLLSLRALIREVHCLHSING